MKKIRFYKNTDYTSLIHLLKKNNMFDKVWDNKKSIEKKRIADNKSIIVVVKKKKIIGCIFLEEYGQCIMFRRLCIQKKYRNQGLGSLLLHQVETIAKKKGIEQIGLFVEQQKKRIRKRYSYRNYKKEKDYTFMYKNITL